MAGLVEYASGWMRRVLRSATAVPPTVARYDQRMYYSMLLANFMALVLHFVWIFVFGSLGLTTLSLVNIASVAVWIFNIALIRRWGAVLTAVVIGSIEVLAHQFLAIYYFGWGYGFQYFLLVIVAFAFMMNFRNMVIPVSLFVVCLVSFLWYYYSVQYWLPHARDDPAIRETFLMANVTTAFTILAIMSYVYSEAARKAEAKLELEQQKSERLLLNILPASIAERLKEGNSVIADHFESTTVMFSDIVGFTALSEKISPTELVQPAQPHLFGVRRPGRAVRAGEDQDDRRRLHGGGRVSRSAGRARQRRVGHGARHARRRSRRATCETEQPVSIRIGIHTGSGRGGRHRHQKVRLRRVGRHREHREPHGVERAAGANPAFRAGGGSPGRELCGRGAGDGGSAGQGMHEDVLVGWAPGVR